MNINLYPDRFVFYRDMTLALTEPHGAVDKILSMVVAISIPTFSNPPACLIGHLELIYVDFYKDQNLANRATTDSPFRWRRNAHQCSYVHRPVLRQRCNRKALSRNLISINILKLNHQQPHVFESNFLPCKASFCRPWFGFQIFAPVAVKVELGFIFVFREIKKLDINNERCTYFKKRKIKLPFTMPHPRAGQEMLSNGN